MELRQRMEYVLKVVSFLLKCWMFVFKMVVCGTD